MPYYGYAKQEKKTTGREPISAKLVANLITTAGADRVLTMDLHAPAIEGFFDIPVDHLQAGPLAGRLLSSAKDLRDVVVVIAGCRRRGPGQPLSRAASGAGLAIIAKQRPEPDVSEVIEMVGDVEGKTAIIVDDMISTGGTLVEAAEALRERGATRIFACATHGIFAGDGLRPDRGLAPGRDRGDQYDRAAARGRGRQNQNDIGRRAVCRGDHADP